MTNYIRFYKEFKLCKAPDCLEGLTFGAGEEIRTLDIHLGKVALYQLSYSRLLSYWLVLLTSALRVSRLYYFHIFLSRALSCFLFVFYLEPSDLVVLSQTLEV
jgi:hypothetical protein